MRRSGAALQYFALQSFTSGVNPIICGATYLISPARCTPICKLARLDNPSAHQRLDVSIILGIRQPFGFVVFPCFFAQNFSIRAYRVAGEIADRAMKAFVWQGQSEWNASIIDNPLPPSDSIGDLLDVVIA